MYRRELRFNDKLLELRDKKIEIVQTILSLHQEYYVVQKLLRASVIRPPVNVYVGMEQDELPET